MREKQRKVQYPCTARHWGFHYKGYTLIMPIQTVHVNLREESCAATNTVHKQLPCNYTRQQNRIKLWSQHADYCIITTLTRIVFLYNFFNVNPMLSLQFFLARHILTPNVVGTKCVQWMHNMEVVYLSVRLHVLHAETLHRFLFLPLFPTFSVACLDICFRRNAYALNVICMVALFWYCKGSITIYSLTVVGMNVLTRYVNTDETRSTKRFVDRLVRSLMERIKGFQRKSQKLTISLTQMAKKLSSPVYISAK